MGSRQKRSKKPSSTKPRPPEYPSFPESPAFVVDQSVGGARLVEALQAVGVRALKLESILSIDAVDPEVFAATVASGAVLLTRDKMMRRRPNERAAIMATKVVIFMPPGGIPYEKKIEAVVSARFRIVQWVKKHRAPFVARILSNGKLEMVDSFDDLDE
jgi:predicted nuclease of predicted toxin-antitoxin system